MAIDTSGPADKKTGTKTGKSPAPQRPDREFNSATHYAEFSTSKVGIGADKKKG